MPHRSASTDRRAHVTKYAVVGLLFVGWLAADLWTKHWADTRLADPRHPLPVPVDASEEGEPVGRLAARHLGLDEGELTDARAPLTRMPEQKPVEPSASVHEAFEEAHALYVVWRGEHTPRRIELNAPHRVYTWLRLAAPEADRATLRERAEGHYADVTVSEWLQENLRRLSADEARRVAREGLHPIRGRLPEVAPDEPAEAETTYLVQWRRIDVMGDWFKLIYAENPGAAFGLLRDVPALVRDVVFGSLTVVVFLVVVGILVRVPPGHWVVLTALTGVLAGAAGNFVDRVRYGFVIDFIDMHLGFMRWPTYNLADVGISVGVVVLMLNVLLDPKSPLAQQPAGQTSGTEPASS